VSGLRGFVCSVVQAVTYPDKHGRPVRRDPTHGRIDREVQWFVQDTYQPNTVAQRVVMEANVQRVWDERGGQP
jgi:hypothetical protein